MHTPLTKEQMDKIVRRYRKCGWSIKRIAKELHISDKRVSHYLKGGCCDYKVVAEKPKNGKGEKGVDLFSKIVKESCSKLNKGIFDYSDLVCRTILEELLDVLKHETSVKEGMKNSEARVRKLRDSLAEVLIEAGIAVIWTMPPALKKLWMDNIGRDPQAEFKNVSDKKSK